MPDFVQRSFTGGEIAEAVYGRPDTVKYQTGVKKGRNAFVKRHGGLANRTGSGYLFEVKDSSVPHRILKFVFNAEQTYVLILGHLNMRFERNGALVRVTSGEAWSNATTYVLGDLVFEAGTYYYCILGHLNQTPPNTTYWYALEENIYEIPTPYDQADLATLYSYAQSGDVVTLDHLSYLPMNLSRTAETTWTLVPAPFEPSQAPPLALTVAAGGAGALTFRYKVTAVAAESFEESLPGREGTKAISGATQAAPCVLTVTAHGYALGDELIIAGVVGMTELNDRTYTISAMTANTLTLSGVDSSAYTAYVSAGTVQRTATSTSSLTGAAQAITGSTNANPCVITAVGHGFANGYSVRILAMFGMTELNGADYLIDNVTANTFELVGIDSTAFGVYSSGGTAQRVVGSGAAAPTSAAPHVVSWAGADGAGEYNVYKELNGVFGFIGTAVGTSFNDTGITPDIEVTPPQVRRPFTSPTNYPRCVGYYDQRKLHGGTTRETEKVWGSRSARFSNYSISSPLQDDDAITFTVAGKQVNEVRHLLDVGNLLILTSGAELIALGDGTGKLLPGVPGLRQVGSNGASLVPPLVIGNNILYIQARGNLVRDFRSVVSQDGTQGYAGDDLSVFAPHLLEGSGQTLVRWDFAQIPNSQAVGVRSDGQMLALTYVREHEIVGWTPWDTDGVYEDVLVVPQGQEDVVYVLVARTIAGQTRRYLERFASRRVTDVTLDALFLDSYLTFDGRNTTATVMTVSGGTDWLATEVLTLEAGAPFFNAADVGNAIELQHYTEASYGEDGQVAPAIDARVMLTIIEYTSETVVLVLAEKTVPEILRDTPMTTWAQMVDEVSGLDHLEGKAVSILGDGNVVANAFDPSPTVVSGGTVALGRPYAVVHVGLGYTTDVETLDLEVLGGETIGAKQKKLIGLTLLVEASRGIWAGPDSDHLTEFKPQHPTPGLAYGLFTGKIELTMASTWNQTGRVFIRQRDPLPMTLLSIMPHGEIGG